MISPKRILVVRLSSVGDVVLATPVPFALRNHYPNAELIWVADAPYAALLQGHPALDRVVAWEKRGRHQGFFGIRRLALELGAIELMIDLQHKPRTTLLAFFLRPQKRVSLIKRRSLAILRTLIGKDPILLAPHQVYRYLQTLSSAIDPVSLPPRLFCPVPAADLRKAKEQSAGIEVPKQKIALIPGARHLTKQWPPANFAALADRLLEKGFGVFLLGGKDDQKIVTSVVEKMQHTPSGVNLEGSLTELAAWLSLCQVAIGPDTGPMHMAAALGVSTLSLFGPTAAARWAPWGKASRVLQSSLACSPCSNFGSARCKEGSYACLASLSPEEVLQALWMLLRQHGERKE